MRWNLALGIVLVIFSSLLASCGSTSAAGALACYASASLASGSTAVANSNVSLTGLSVQISGGVGPFSVNIPNAGTFSTTVTTYPYPQTVSEPTDASGAVSATVGVTDTSNNTSASCAITNASNQLSSSSIVVTATVNGVAVAYGQSVPLGSTVVLTATDSISGAAASFTYAASVNGTALTSGVATAAGEFLQASSTQAEVYSSTSETFTITVSDTNGTTSQTITFGSGSSTVLSSGGCTMSGAPMYTYSIPGSVFTATVTAAPGQAVQVTQSSLANCFTQQGNSDSSIVLITCALPIASGSFAYQVLASAGGVACNGGQPLTFTVNVN